MIGDTFWPALCDLLDIDELRSSEFATAPVRLEHKAYIEGLISEKLLTRPAAEWLEALEAARIPCARVNNIAQALEDPQILHRHMVVEVEHPAGGRVKVPGNPIKLSGTPAERFSPPPLLGAHTREVFAEWAEMPQAQIEQGMEAGVIA